ncbi:MAG: hypothetical protein IPK19_23495 [Chloroflexi bacterium]|nr:hypothetical protein [Chloroflexota bacterium]
MKYPKPSIVALNLESSEFSEVHSFGYNIKQGIFGFPYQVATHSQMQPVYGNPILPYDLSEAEIVVIDLSVSVLETAPGSQMQSATGDVWLMDAPHGIIDPRTLAMLEQQRTLNRVLRYGGVFIVFAEQKMYYQPYLRSIERTTKRVDQVSNWVFLGDLANIKAESAYGSEIQVTSENTELAQILRRYFSDAYYSTALTLPDSREYDFVTLATNKYGQSVAAILNCPNHSDEKKPGIVLLLPHPKQKGAMLRELLEDYLPQVRPDLFPYLDHVHWIDQSEYQPHQVRTLQAKILQVEEQARQAVSQLLQQIADFRADAKYLADLIVETDKALVHAVKQALEVVGFKDVVDYDKELQDRGATEMREDLHIRDRLPTILVEIKGVKGTSSESQALQVGKYLFPRAKELGTTELRGLSIINHQRHLPPLERRQQPFSEDIQVNAAKQHLGLLTTWNLYKLVVNFLKFGWTHDLVADIFYQNGFIEPIPKHYEYVGVVRGYVEKLGVVGIEMKQGELRIGDRIAFELPIEFEEQQVDSMELNQSLIPVAREAMHIGIKTCFNREQLRDKVRVFRLNPEIWTGQISDPAKTTTE